MKYISIGSSCGVKYQIDTNTYKKKTLFFDWLLTSMQSIIQILSCNNISDILYIDNIHKHQLHDDNKNAHICIKSLHYCISIHDFLNNYTHNDILNFIDKYKRRFGRIIEYIHSDEKLYFIRFGKVSDEHRQQFIETITKINPKCIFKLVVIDNDNTNNVEKIKYDNCLYFKLNINVSTPDWTLSFIDWKQIFADMDNDI